MHLEGRALGSQGCVSRVGGLGSQVVGESGSSSLRTSETSVDRLKAVTSSHVLRMLSFRIFVDAAASCLDHLREK